MIEEAIVLASGGVDSTVTLAMAALNFPVLMMHFNYGQRTQRKELDCFCALSEYYNAEEWIVVDIPELGEIRGSSLTDEGIEIPEGVLEDRTVPSTYVPFRNGLMLSYAAAWAEAMKIKHIFIGVVGTDVPGYPDCSIKFIRAMETAINLGRKPESRLQIHTPIITMQKYEVVKKGLELNVPFNLTWSCYKSEGVACGKCTSCLGRIEAFRKAGYKDPIKYHVWV